MTSFNTMFTSMVRDTSGTQMRADHEGYVNLVNNGHYAMSWLMANQSEKDTFQLGHTLQATLYAKKASTVQRHGGGKLRVEYSNKQTGTQITSGMSWQTAHLGWNEDEVAANLHPSMGPEYVLAQFEELLAAKEQNLNQDMLDEWEEGLWLPADLAAMHTDGSQCKSIPYYITEASTLPLDVTTSAAAGADTALVSLNGTTLTAAPGYDNVRTTYAATGGAAGNADDLLGAILGAARRAHFEILPMGATYADKESMPNVVLCSNVGMDYAVATFRKDQTVWAAREETLFGLKVAGLIFRNIDELDDAPLYSGANGTLYGEMDTANTFTGPRYYGISGKHMSMKFQTGRFMHRDEPTNLTAGNYPYEWVQVVKSKGQLWCQDRRRHFIVSPSANL